MGKCLIDKLVVACFWPPCNVTHLYPATDAVCQCQDNMSALSCL